MSRFGVDGIIRWKQDGDPLVLQSPNFATQKYTVEANRGGTDLSILGSLNVDLGVIFSDIRLKRDIARVGTLDNGLPLYRYKYLWSDQVFVGVMAQEVADVAPDAVVKGDDGYLRVNYAQLGTSMKSLGAMVRRARLAVAGSKLKILPAVEAAARDPRAASLSG